MFELLGFAVKSITKNSMNNNNGELVIGNLSPVNVELYKSFLWMIKDWIS
jgi:hypothetical protein